MSRQALSDDQVSQELKKMTAFIKQEASEKAYEIEINADEEFAKEKSRLVREETASIDAVYAKKSKAAAMSQQITRSTVANKTRLRVLAARQGLLDGIFEEAAGRLGVLAREGRGYEEVLKNLMLEGFYALDEPEVVVRVRKADEEVAKKAIEAAEREYRENMKKEVKASVDGEEYLPAGCAGGLSIVGGGGKIDINNTFEERLRLLEDAALPAIRTTLFGKNPNRKFYD